MVGEIATSQLILKFVPTSQQIIDRNISCFNQVGAAQERSLSRKRHRVEGRALWALCAGEAEFRQSNQFP
jgi:hypothetical protein